MDLLQNKEVSCELFAIDPTPKSLEFLNKQDLPQNFHVLPYALAASDCEIKFKLPKRKGWISGTAIDATQDSRRLDMKNSVNVKGRSIKSLMTELRHTHIDLLKMDIEGSEFDVLESVLLDDSIVIRELCFDHHEGMLKGDGFGRMKRLMSLIKEKYRVFYTDNDLKHAKYVACILKE